ncbi:hypothetical protein [Amycolatopsis australiensis]|uniref:LPXTG-motif cell wall anchor domain-containing protein n=1 Tax=Amycolatopsis australiensis TaxID=546364 RepID=A0A1K1R339_9PSEU|nr:hypothetical protein [Amycolatopsis australiensis]SFW65998.1 hypothetical protein SAMN04489730_2559 [Amycolatopsis australiensis]
MSRRALVLAVLTGAALLMTAPVSGAAQAAGISSADAAAAHAAAVRLQDTLVGFFAQAPDARGPVTVQVSPDAYPVYELSPDFVGGKPGAAPGDFAYFAVPARASDGRTATLWSVRGDNGTWQVGNIASGDVEGAFARQLPPGAQLLHEPQVDAWYAVRDGRVTPLSEAKPAVAVADYQRTVEARYADKLPGSAYAREGEAGGYDATSQVMPRGDGSPAPAGHDTGWVPLLILAGVLAVSGAGYVLHLRRHPA